MAKKEKIEGDKARKWLKREGLTMRQFADACGFDYGTVWHWFARGVNPRRTEQRFIKATYPSCPLAGSAT